MQEYYIANNVFKEYLDEPDQVTIGNYFQGFQGCDQEMSYYSIEDFIIQQLINCNNVEKFYHYLGYQDAASMIIEFIIYSHFDNSDDSLERAGLKEGFWLDLIIKYFGATRNHDNIKKHNKILKSLEDEPHIRCLGPEDL